MDWWIYAIIVVAVVCAALLIWAIKETLYAPLKPEDEEMISQLPGNDLIDKNEVKMHTGRGVTIKAPPEKIFPYLKQLGCHKAGFYSYSKLERLFGFHIYNDLTVEQKWQDTKIGDWVPYRQNGAGTGIVDMKENEYMLTLSDSRKAPTDLVGMAWHPPGFDFLAWTWNFYTIPINDGKHTRLLSMNDVAWGKANPFWFVIAFMIYGITGNIMTGKLLSTLKGCAEGTNRKANRQKARNAMRARKFKVGDPTWGHQ